MTAPRSKFAPSAPFSATAVSRGEEFVRVLPSTFRVSFPRGLRRALVEAVNKAGKVLTLDADTLRHYPHGEWVEWEEENIGG